MNRTDITTTLSRIREHDPCEPGYKALCKGLGGLRRYGKSTPITVRRIVEINGLDDALWCLRTMPEHNARWRMLAVWYARHVRHLMADQRSLHALDIVDRHANGQATDYELADATHAAWAARAAALSARISAKNKLADSRKTAWDIILSNEESETQNAEEADKEADARVAAEAAFAAAQATSLYALSANESITRSIELVAKAAALAVSLAAESGERDTARDAERRWQAEELIRICEEEY